MHNTLAFIATLVIAIVFTSRAEATNGPSENTSPVSAKSSFNSVSSLKKDVTALMKESQSLREAAAKEKNVSAKLKAVKEFEMSLTNAIKAYEKASPTEGDEAEEKVVKFSFRFEPVFELSKKKFTKSDCDKARGRIELEDQSGKPEGSPLSANAEEALKWLDVLCK